LSDYFPATTQEVVDEAQEDNAEEGEISPRMEEEMKGNVRKKPIP
jgi:hypothetical protein